MRVLLAVTNADLAGAPIHVRDLALQLRSAGCTVKVVFGEAGPIQDLLEQSGIATCVIPSMRSTISPLNDLLSFLRLRALAKEYLPDLLHLHSTKAGLVGRLVAWSLRLPAVYTVHGWGFGSGRRWHVSIPVFIAELVCRPITRMYIAVSNADRIIGLKRLGISPTRIVTIYNATQFSSHNSRPLIAGLRIIMVARNDHQKDYETFFRALARVCFESADVVGRGTDHCSFVAWARGLAGLNASKIRFLGCRPDVEILLENANLMILSSRFEGLPISIIEAMSKSLPVLASNVGGVPELVESGLNGFLFESGDVDHLVSLISLMNEQPKMRYSMGEESRSRFERNFTLQTMLENTMVQYALALSSSRAPCSTTCVFPNLLRRDG